MLLGVLFLASAACGSAAASTEAKVPHVGFLSVSATPKFIQALREGLSDLGYVEDETIIIDWRVARDRDELQGIAQEFVRNDVDLIIAGGTKAVKAAMKETSTIPIVMTNSGDAVGTGDARTVGTKVGDKILGHGVTSSFLRYGARLTGVAVGCGVCDGSGATVLTGGPGKSGSAHAVASSRSPTKPAAFTAPLPGESQTG